MAQLHLNSVIGFVVLPGIVFGAAYFPILRTLSRSLVAAYSRADERKRALAGGVDIVLVATAWWSYLNSGSLQFLILGLIYVGFRDAILGRSAGKFLFGIVVVSLETGQPSGIGHSMRRNLVFLIPGANIVALFLEPVTIVRDPQGQRLGDRMALTQVVEGFGLKDLAESLVRWLSFNSLLFDEVSRRPERAPGKAERRRAA